MPGESSLYKKVIKWLKQHDIYYFKVIRADRSGVFDLCVILDGGSAIMIELKSPTNYNKASALQLYEGTMMDRREIPNIVSRDFSEIVTFISSLIECRDLSTKHCRSR